MENFEQKLRELGYVIDDNGRPLSITLTKKRVTTIQLQPSAVIEERDPTPYERLKARKSELSEKELERRMWTYEWCQRNKDKCREYSRRHAEKKRRLRALANKDTIQSN